MKKYISLGLVTAVLLLTAAIVPNAVSSFLPRVELIRIGQTIYQSTVSAGGTVEELSKQEVALTVPVVPGKVYKEVGDTVKAGDVIAEVDQNATKTALLSLSSTTPDLLSKEVLASLTGEGGGNGEDVSAALPEQVVATSEGVITSMNLTEGTLCESGTAATIANSTDLRVKIAVNESNIASVKEGQKVTLTGAALQKTYTGTVAKVYPSAHKQLAGTVQETVVDVLVNIDDPDEGMRPGFTVQAKVKTGQEKAVRVLPYEAVSQDEQGNEFVYVYQSGRAVRRDVVTGLTTSDGVEIIAGVGPDAQIIANAADVSSDKAYVRPVG